MDRKYLEPQLQAILSHMIDMNGGYDWVSEYLARAAESGEESMDDRTVGELKAVQGVMELISMISNDPDFTEFLAQRIGYKIGSVHTGNLTAQTWPTPEQAVEYADKNFTAALKKDNQFMLVEVTEGIYKQYKNIRSFGFPVEAKKDES